MWPRNPKCRPEGWFCTCWIHETEATGHRWVPEAGRCGCPLSVRLPTPCGPPPSTHLSPRTSRSSRPVLRSHSGPRTIRSPEWEACVVFSKTRTGAPSPGTSQGRFPKEPIPPSRSEVPLGRFTRSLHTTVSPTAGLLPATPRGGRKGGHPFPGRGSGQPQGGRNFSKGRFPRVTRRQLVASCVHL